MKLMTILFWIAVAGVGVSLVGSIATAVRQRSEPAPVTGPAIPLPAEAPTPR